MPQTASVYFKNKPVNPAKDPQMARMVPKRLKPSTTFLRGQLLGELTASPDTCAPYNAGGGDGSQNWRFVLPMDCVTDAQGNISLSDTAAVGDQLQTYQTISVWYCGDFYTADLPTLTDTILATWPGAHMISGPTVAVGGIVRLP